MNSLQKGLFWASSYTTFPARTGPVRKASEDRKVRFFQILNHHAKAWGKYCIKIYKVSLTPLFQSTLRWTSMTGI